MSRGTSAAICLCACLGAALPTLGQQPSSANACGEACPAQPEGGGHSTVALMQLKTAVQQRAAEKTAARGGLGSLLPAMRTFVSTDPSKSAEFVTTYFRAKAVPAPSCGGAKVAVVEIDLGAGVQVRYQFVADETKPAGSLAPDDLVPLLAPAWKDWVAKRASHVAWMDNHDAFPVETFLPNKAAADGVVMEDLRAMLGSSALCSLYRVYIPHTLWTVEFVEQDCGLDGESTGPILDIECRDLTMPTHYDTPWRKSTFMTSRPMDAATFAVDVLGAVRLESAYPTTPTSNSDCVLAEWVQFPGSGLQLHFAYHESEPAVGPSVREFEAYLTNLRSYKDGVFDRYMYNSLVFPVDSLEPLVGRLQSRGLPFFVMAVNDAEYALFTDIPETGITLQFRSANVGSDLHPLPSSACQASL